MITAVAVSGTGCSQTQPASIDYKTADKVADGAILQAFCWDFNKGVNGGYCRSRFFGCADISD